MIDKAYPYPDDDVYSHTYGFDIVKVTTFLAESLEHDDLVGHGMTPIEAVEDIKRQLTISDKEPT